MNNQLDFFSGVAFVTFESIDDKDLFMKHYKNGHLNIILTLFFNF